MEKKKRAALYVRVSTDKQSVDNQIQALTKDAKDQGWDIVEVYKDIGISGAKGRKDRPGLDQMLTDAKRRKFDVVMVWAIDRMGRSLIDLLKTIQHLEKCKVDVFIEQQKIDTTTDEGELFFHIVGAFGQYERKMIVSRVNAGLDRARANNTKLGRPKLDPKTEDKIKDALATGGLGMRKIAAKYKVGTGTVQRVSAAMGK